MTWKNEIKRCLEEYRVLKKGLSIVLKRIRDIDKILKRQQNTAEETSATLNDFKMNLYAERMILTANFKRAKLVIDSVESAMSQLNDEQKLILTEMYVDKNPDWESKLGSALRYQRRSLYLAAGNALRDFGMIYYLLPNGF